MNEELKIIITAAVAEATKNLEKVKTELKDTGEQGDKSGAKVGAALKGVATAAAVAIAAVTAVVTALVQLGEKSKEFQQSYNRLTASFQTNGSTVKQATQTYKDLFRFMGETDTATEAANLLVQLTNDEKELAEWTNILKGAYATFPDSLPVEALAESANETAKVGKITGNLADSLVWLGVSEDAFNAKLEQTNSHAEREALIRSTLTGLYGDAAAAYEKTNSAIMKHNESQANLDLAMAKVSQSILPLMTALNNVSTAFFNTFGPAISTVTNYLTAFTQAIADAISWLGGFFGIVGTVADEANAGMESLQSSTKGVGQSLENTAKNAGGATKALKELKKLTMGFDELNIVSSNDSTSGGGGGTSATASTPTFARASTPNIASALENIKQKTQAFNWYEVGSNIGKKMMDAMEKVDWTTAGYTIGKLVTDAAAAIIGLGFSIDPKVIMGAELGLLGGILQGLSDGIGQLDWAEIGGKIVEMLIFGAITTLMWLNPFAALIAIMLAPNGDELAKGAASLVGSVIGALLAAVVGVVQKIAEIGITIWQTIKNALDENINWQGTPKEIIFGLLNAIKSIFSSIGTWIKTNLWIPFRDGFKNAFNSQSTSGLVTWFSDLYAKIKNVFSNIGSWFKNTFNNAVTNIKNVFNNIPTFFTQTRDKIKTIFSNMGATIGNAITNTVKSAINGVLSTAVKIINGFIKSINIAIGVINAIPGVEINKLDTLSVPKLARGGIVTSETLARIGEGGKREAVLPLEQNTGWMDMLADRFSARNGASKPLYLMVDKKVLGQVTADGINGITALTGQIPLKLY